MNNPKNHHFVPDSSYLGEFTDPNCPPNYSPYVWVFSKDGKNKKNKAPENIFKVNNLYTMENSNDGKDFFIEETLSKIESTYATVFREKIKKMIPLTEVEHLTLCTFTSAMLFRTLRYKENIEGFIQQTIDMTAAMEKQHGLDTKKSDELKELKKNIHKLNLIDMIPPITNILCEMKLAFLCAENNARFITSDDPCSLFNPDLQWQKFLGPGFGQKNIQLTLPLSPQITACFTWSNLRGYMKFKDSRVNELNRLTRAQCHKEFIHCFPKTKLVWFSSFPYDLKFIIFVILKRKISLLFRKKYKKHG